MSAARNAALFSLYVIFALAITFGFFSIVHAEGTEADKMCTPFYEQCGCDQVPDPKTGKCVHKDPEGELPHSNVNGCGVGTCKDTTKGYITSGICTAANQCKGITCGGKPCEQAEPGGKPNASGETPSSDPPLDDTGTMPQPPAGSGSGSGGTTPGQGQTPSSGSGSSDPPLDDTGQQRPASESIFENAINNLDPKPAPAGSPADGINKAFNGFNGLEGTDAVELSPPPPSGSGSSDYPLDDTGQGAPATGFQPPPTSESDQSWWDRNVVDPVRNWWNGSAPGDPVVADPSLSDGAPSGSSADIPTTPDTTGSFNGLEGTDAVEGQTSATTQEESWWDSTKRLANEYIVQPVKDFYSNYGLSDSGMAADVPAAPDTNAPSVPTEEQLRNEAANDQTPFDRFTGPGTSPTDVTKAPNLGVPTEAQLRAEAGTDRFTPGEVRANEERLALTQTALEQANAKIAEADAKYQDSKEKFDERWAPYRQCQDVCSSQDTTYDIRDKTELAEFKRMNEELDTQAKEVQTESARAREAYSDYREALVAVVNTPAVAQVDQVLNDQQLEHEVAATMAANRGDTATAAAETRIAQAIEGDRDYLARSPNADFIAEAKLTDPKLLTGDQKAALQEHNTWTTANQEIKDTQAKIDANERTITALQAAGASGPYDASQIARLQAENAAMANDIARAQVKMADADSIIGRYADGTSTRAEQVLSNSLAGTDPLHNASQSISDYLHRAAADTWKAATWNPIDYATSLTTGAIAGIYDSAANLAANIPGAEGLSTIADQVASLTQSPMERMAQAIWDVGNVATAPSLARLGADAVANVAGSVRNAVGDALAIRAFEGVGDGMATAELAAQSGRPAFTAEVSGRFGAQEVGVQAFTAEGAVASEIRAGYAGASAEGGALAQSNVYKNIDGYPTTNGNVVGGSYVPHVGSEGGATLGNAVRVENAGAATEFAQTLEARRMSAVSDYANAEAQLKAANTQAMSDLNSIKAGDYQPIRLSQTSPELTAAQRELDLVGVKNLGNNTFEVTATGERIQITSGSAPASVAEAAPAAATTISRANADVLANVSVDSRQAATAAVKDFEAITAEKSAIAANGKELSSVEQRVLANREADVLSRLERSGLAPTGEGTAVRAMTADEIASAKAAESSAVQTTKDITRQTGVDAIDAKNAAPQLSRPLSEALGDALNSTWDGVKGVGSNIKDAFSTPGQIARSINTAVQSGMSVVAPFSAETALLRQGVAATERVGATGATAGRYTASWVPAADLKLATESSLQNLAKGAETLTPYNIIRSGNTFVDGAPFTSIAMPRTVVDTQGVTTVTPDGENWTPSSAAPETNNVAAQPVAPSSPSAFETGAPAINPTPNNPALANNSSAPSVSSPDTTGSIPAAQNTGAQPTAPAQVAPVPIPAARPANAPVPQPFQPSPVQKLSPSPDSFRADLQGEQDFAEAFAAAQPKTWGDWLSKDLPRQFSSNPFGFSAQASPLQYSEPVVTVQNTAPQAASYPSVPGTLTGTAKNAYVGPVAPGDPPPVVYKTEGVGKNAVQVPYAQLPSGELIRLETFEGKLWPAQSDQIGRFKLAQHIHDRYGMKQPTVLALAKAHPGLFEVVDSPYLYAAFKSDADQIAAVLAKLRFQPEYANPLAASKTPNYDVVLRIWSSPDTANGPTNYLQHVERANAAGLQLKTPLAWNDLDTMSKWIQGMTWGEYFGLPLFNNETLAAGFNKFYAKANIPDAGPQLVAAWKGQSGPTVAQAPVAKAPTLASTPAAPAAQNPLTSPKPLKEQPSVQNPAQSPTRNILSNTPIKSQGDVGARPIVGQAPTQNFLAQIKPVVPADVHSGIAGVNEIRNGFELFDSVGRSMGVVTQSGDTLAYLTPQLAGGSPSLNIPAGSRVAIGTNGEFNAQGLNIGRSNFGPSRGPSGPVERFTYVVVHETQAGKTAAAKNIDVLLKNSRESNVGAQFFLKVSTENGALKYRLEQNFPLISDPGHPLAAGSRINGVGRSVIPGIHNGNTINIENICDNFCADLTAEERDYMAKINKVLVSRLQDAFNIPSQNVVSHSTAAGSRKSGEAVWLEKILAANPHVPNGTQVAHGVPMNAPAPQVAQSPVPISQRSFVAYSGLRPSAPPADTLTTGAVADAKSGGVNLTSPNSIKDQTPILKPSQGTAPTLAVAPAVPAAAPAVSAPAPISDAIPIPQARPTEATGWKDFVLKRAQEIRQEQLQVAREAEAARAATTKAKAEADAAAKAAQEAIANFNKQQAAELVKILARLEAADDAAARAAKEAIARFDREQAAEILALQKQFAANAEAEADAAAKAAKDASDTAAILKALSDSKSRAPFSQAKAEQAEAAAKAKADGLAKEQVRLAAEAKARADEAARAQAFADAAAKAERDAVIAQTNAQVAALEAERTALAQQAKAAETSKVAVRLPTPMPKPRPTEANAPVAPGPSIATTASIPLPVSRPSSAPTVASTQPAPTSIPNPEIAPLTKQITDVQREIDQANRILTTLKSNLNAAEKANSAVQLAPGAARAMLADPNLLVGKSVAAARASLANAQQLLKSTEKIQKDLAIAPEMRGRLLSQGAQLNAHVNKTLADLTQSNGYEMYTIPASYRPGIQKGANDIATLARALTETARTATNAKTPVWEKDVTELLEKKAELETKLAALPETTAPPIQKAPTLTGAPATPVSVANPQPTVPAETTGASSLPESTLPGMQQAPTTPPAVIKAPVPNQANYTLPKALRELAYYGVVPVGYHRPYGEFVGDSAKRIFQDALHGIQTGEHRIITVRSSEVEYGLPTTRAVKNRLDAWGTYLGLPQKYETFSMSQYRPAVSQENKQYYKINGFLQNFIDSAIDVPTGTGGANLLKTEADVIKFLREKVTSDPFALNDQSVTVVDVHNGIMGGYKLSLGRDVNGDYVSYYDIWNLEGSSEGASGVVGKPFEIYDRVYYDPVTYQPVYPGAVPSETLLADGPAVPAETTGVVQPATGGTPAAPATPAPTSPWQRLYSLLNFRSRVQNGADTLAARPSPITSVTPPPPLPSMPTPPVEPPTLADIPDELGGFDVNLPKEEVKAPTETKPNPAKPAESPTLADIPDELGGFNVSNPWKYTTKPAVDSVASNSLLTKAKDLFKSTCLSGWRSSVICGLVVAAPFENMVMNNSTSPTDGGTPTGTTPPKDAGQAGSVPKSGNSLTPSGQLQPCGPDQFTTSLSATPCGPSEIKVTNAVTKPQPVPVIPKEATAPSVTGTVPNKEPTITNAPVKVDQDQKQVTPAVVSPRPITTQRPPGGPQREVPQPLPYPVIVGTPAPQNARISNYSMYMIGNMIGQFINSMFGSSGQGGSQQTQRPSVPSKVSPPIAPPPVQPTTTPSSLAPVVSLVANPGTVTSGGVASLSWASIGATSCALSVRTSATSTVIATGLTGSKDTPPLATSTTYVIRCASASGLAGSGTTTVIVR